MFIMKSYLILFVMFMAFLDLTFTETPTSVMMSLIHRNINCDCDDIYVDCGGTFIKKNFILTNAECVFRWKFCWNFVKIYLNEETITKDTDSKMKIIDATFKQKIYKYLVSVDIAIVKVIGDAIVVFSNLVPVNTKLIASQQLISNGYGTLFNKLTESNKITQKKNITLLAGADSVFSFIFSKLYTEKYGMFITGKLCSLDIGGPIYLTDEGKNYLVGTVGSKKTFDKKCNDLESVSTATYLNAKEVRDFINNN